MKIINIFSSLLFAVFASSSCTPKVVEEFPDGAIFTKHFIEDYIVADSIVMQFHHDRCIDLFFEYGTHIGPYAAETNARKYDELCIKWGDTMYNQHRAPGGAFYAMAEEFDSILVVCNRDFDSQHPAGTSLTDIVKMCTSTCYPYISSGYKNITDTAHIKDVGVYYNQYGGPQYSIIFKPLNELSKDDMKMLYTCWTLYFDKLPPRGIYTFTVTLKNSKKQYQKSITCEF